MIRVYSREFIAICSYLEKKECRKIKKCFCVERPEMEMLLSKNGYETPNNKLKVWKQLQWLDADEQHYTKQIFDGKKGKNSRVFALKIDVYLALKELTK